MSSKSSPLQIHQVLFAILVLLASPQTFAEFSCKKLYSKLSVYAETNAEITILSANTDSLMKLLKIQPDMFDSKQLRAQVLDLMQHAEKYFEAAQISFEPIKERIQIQGLSDRDTYVLHYTRYKIRGSMMGDEIARMIFGVEKHPNFQNHPVDFIYDPLFQKKHSGDRAAFDGGKHWAILFGSDVFLSRNGESNSLRHEIQHYHEAIKVKEGKMTLARIQLENSIQKRKMKYAKLMSMDELETHIRDLRELLNMPVIQNKDERMAQIKTAAKMSYIRTFRRELLQKKIETLSELLSNALEMNTLVSKALPRIEGDWSRGPGADGNTEYEFSFPPAFPYETVKVDLQGLLNLKTASSNQVRDALIEVFHWNLKRADEIQKEFDQLKFKAQELGLLREKSE